MRRTTWLMLVFGIVFIAMVLMLRRQRDTPAVIIDSPSPVSATEMTNVQVAGAAADGAAAVIREKTDMANHLRVIVQDEQGHPLEGVAVQTSIRGTGAAAIQNFNRLTNTMSDGIADVLWPMQAFEKLELLVSKDNYASRKMVWDLKTGDNIPATHTVLLKAGLQIGGFVVDAEGNPVADAVVSLSRFWRGGEEHLNKGEEPSFSIQKHTTGLDGRWSARNIPPELLYRIGIAASHTNYIIGDKVSTEGNPQVEQELLAGTYKLRLRRGLEVRGIVINEMQQPIPDARVFAGEKYSPQRQETQSNTEGRFIFRNLKEGMMAFSVLADGYAATSKSHKVDASAGEFLFQLTKGSIIQGIVQNEFNEPIQGVRVALEGSPGTEEHNFEFSTIADIGGRFSWTGAPNRPMPFYFSKTGYEQRRRIRLVPKEENIVILRQNRQVQGLVLDAETGRPVTNFTIAIGRRLGEDQLYPDGGRAKDFKNDRGLFSEEIHEEKNDGIRATSRDYADQVQALSLTEGSPIQIVFNLRRSKALVGTVVTLDGRPASDASVSILDRKLGGGSVRFAQGQLLSASMRTKIVKTDAAGRFEIPSPPETGALVAASHLGYRSTTVDDVKASGIVTLQPLGRIEGVLIQGTTPGAGQEVRIVGHDSGISPAFEFFTQIADAEGRFTFENVPPGKASIARVVRVSSASRAYSHETEGIVVAPGQTSQVVLGGNAGTVHGQVRFETAPAEGEYTISAQLRTVMPQLPGGLNPREQSALQNSPAWNEQVKNGKHYAAIVKPDGTMVLDSVAPGQYTLTITAQKSYDAGFGEKLGAKPFASGETTVTVPADAHPGVPIHVGEVVLSSK